MSVVQKQTKRPSNTESIIKKKTKLFSPKENGNNNNDNKFNTIDEGNSSESSSSNTPSPSPSPRISNNNNNSNDNININISNFNSTNNSKRNSMEVDSKYIPIKSVSNGKTNKFNVTSPKNNEKVTKVKTKNFVKQYESNLKVKKEKPKLQRKSTIRNMSKGKKYVFGDPNKNGLLLFVREKINDGIHVWPAAVLLSEFLWNEPSIITNQCVLELGSGCGLPGLLCAKLSAKKVILSDATKFTKVLENLKHNLKINELLDQEDKITVMPLTWGRFSRETIQLRPNVMIGSDIFYDENDFEQILCNMQYYFERGCRSAYIVLQNRGTSRELGALLLKWKMKVEEIEVEHIVMNSNYLNLEDALKLMLIKLTSVKANNRSSHRRMKSVLGMMGEPNFYS